MAAIPAALHCKARLDLCRGKISPIRKIGACLPARHRANVACRCTAVEDLEFAKEAITYGLTLYDKGEYGDALAVFQRALDLPGTGLKRYRDKPRQISQGEQQAALYNIACAHARMGEVQEGLLAVKACLDVEYEDYAQLRSDPDLEALRADERWDQFVPMPPTGGNFFSKLFSK